MVRLEEPYILLHERKISAMRDLLPILEQVQKAGKPILIMAEAMIADKPQKGKSSVPAVLQEDIN